jgi:hypothetical protein
MVQPVDYFGGIRPPDMSSAVMGGLQSGLAMRQVNEADAAKQAAIEAHAQYGRDLSATLENPTPQAFAALIAAHPEQRKALGQSWEMLDKDQQNQQFNSGVQVYSALRSGRPDIAAGVVDENIAALENSGKDASHMKSIREQLKTDPKSVEASMGLTMSSLDPDKWGKIAGEMRESEMAPAKLSEAQAKAQKAGVDAKFAESQAVMDLNKKGWDITKLQNDMAIAGQNSKIAAMNAGLKKETNDLKRQELQVKVNDATTKRDDAVREKVAGVESGRTQMDNMLTTADRILKTPFGVIDDVTGPINSKLPTTGQEEADFEELVTTLGSQAFMAQIPSLKGMGALSNAEGEKLQSALQNLSLRQSPERLIENVKEAQRLILKGRSSLADRHGIPDTIPDRQQADTAAKGMPQGFTVLGVEGQ